MKRRKIALLGGSFDPVHTGHLILASYVAQFCDVDEVWLSLSPTSPFKQDRRMASDTDRRTMLEIAVAGNENLRVCDVELSMPRPSYTITTLRYLREQYPDCDFLLLIGSDNYPTFDKWRESESIRNDFGLLVYPRPGYSVSPTDGDSNVVFIDAPMVEISSSFVRNSIAQGRDMNFFVVPGVYEYIMSHKLYTETT